MTVINRPNADVHIALQPRTTLKLRECFHTLAGAATLKVGLDYLYDYRSARQHSWRLKASLKENALGGKLSFRKGEASVTKKFWLDARTRVNVWVALHVPSATPSFGFKIVPFKGVRGVPIPDPAKPDEELAFSPYSLPPLRMRNQVHLRNSPITLQSESSLQFNPYVSYSTDGKNLGLGSINITLEQLNLLLQVNAARVIPRSWRQRKLLTPLDREQPEKEKLPPWRLALNNVNDALGQLQASTGRSARDLTVRVERAWNLLCSRVAKRRAQAEAREKDMSSARKT